MIRQATGHDIYALLNLKSTDSLYGVYAGWQQIGGTKAPTKLGRCKNPVALQRGRSQGGADWWFGCYYLLESNELTRTVERALKRALHNQRKAGTQRQTELYSFGMPRAISSIESILQKHNLPIDNILLRL